MGNELQFSTSLFVAHQQLLRERLHYLLSSLHPAVFADVVRSLQDSGKLLSNNETSTTPAGLWPLITLFVAQDISPAIDASYAADIAIAIECLICSFDLLDDVEDDDQSPVVRELGPARALNTSTVLLTLAQKSILSTIQFGIPFERIMRLLDTLQKGIFTATSGQHLDLLAEQRAIEDMTIEDCLEIAAGKGGSLMQLACCLGALCANADEILYEQISTLGKAVGIFSQLDNDCHDLYHLLYSSASTKLAVNMEANRVNLKTDLIRGKKTLPILFAAKKDEALWRQLSTSGEGAIDNYRHVFDQGIASTWAICQLYLESAREILQNIEAHQPISLALKRLLNLS